MNTNRTNQNSQPRQEARAAARKAAEIGDDGTNDLFVKNVIRANEMQVWFPAEHAV